MQSKIEVWRKQAEVAKAKRDKELGKQEMLLKTMKEQYGCDSLEELKEKIAKAEEYANTLFQLREEKINDFRDRFADKLADAAR
jgi:F0F1-type ATP synthase membrane subunit b/b'